jgi:hypothetical protein
MWHSEAQSATFRRIVASLPSRPNRTALRFGAVRMLCEMDADELGPVSAVIWTARESWRYFA